MDIDDWLEQAYEDRFALDDNDELDEIDEIDDNESK